MIINPKLLYKVVVRSPCPRFVQMTHCLKEEMATHKPFAETKKEGETKYLLCLGAGRSLPQENEYWMQTKLCLVNKLPGTICMHYLPFTTQVRSLVRPCRYKYITKPDRKKNFFVKLLGLSCSMQSTKWCSLQYTIQYLLMLFVLRQWIANLALKIMCTLGSESILYYKHIICVVEAKIMS